MNPMASTTWLGAILLAYLLGSIPFGLVLPRLFTDIDIRKAGSGNVDVCEKAGKNEPEWNRSEQVGKQDCAQPGYRSHRVHP